MNVWTKYDYGTDAPLLWQRECTNCDKGLLLAPARFCPVCGGSGYIVTATPPDDEE